MEKPKRTILKAGTMVGPTEIVEVIGHGGMGSVYRAKHLALGKDVALKILAQGYAEEERYREAFLQEAKIAARLEDAHIVQTYDVGEENGLSYIVMQLAQGESLRDRLKRGKLSVAEALEIIEKIARGLQVAHEAGIVHRDIKPHNIVLTGDNVGLKILDFGLARLEQELQERESVIEIVGSMAFMAPEQIDYEPVDARTDIYALGVTAFQCLTGSLPFRAVDDGGHYELLARQLFEPPMAPCMLNRDVPITVSRVILKMLEKEPEDRYQRTEDILDEIRLLRRHSLPAAKFKGRGSALNQKNLEGGKKLAELTRLAIRVQRDVYKSGRDVVSLRQRASEFALKWLEPAVRLFPKDVVFLNPIGTDTRVALSEAVIQAKAYDYRGRMRVIYSEDGRTMRIEILGEGELQSVEAHYLFDLLEATESMPPQVELALSREYALQAQDVRWIVDAFNIVGIRDAELTLFVSSTQNYDTLVRLGLEEHMRVRLEHASEDELGLTTEVNLDEELDLDDFETEELEASPAQQREKTARIKELVSDGEHTLAFEAWKEIAAEQESPNETMRSIKHGLYESIYRAGEEAYAKGKFADTERLNAMLIELEASRFEGHFGMGLVLKKLKKFPAALEALSKAVIAAPDNAEIFYHRAIVRSRVGDDQGALRDLTMAIEHNPRHANSYFNRSKLNKKLGRNRESEQDAEVAGQLDARYRKSSARKAPANRSD